MTTKREIEIDQLDIGIVALTDCAPLIVAQKMGFFTAEGLNVALHVQYSWATIRDRLTAGLLDAAQMLAPMPIASTLGLNGQKCDIINGFNLSLNGNGITLSNAIMEDIRELNGGLSPTLPMPASWLKRLIEKTGKKLRIAAVYPYSCQYYQLRDWLSAGGVDLEVDVELLITPPTSMTRALAEGDIDGFCVGTPWNAQAVRSEIGETVITSKDIWPDQPEKVLAVTAEWQKSHPNTYLAMLSAVKRACEWLTPVANRFEAAVMLTEYIDAPVEVIAPSLLDSCLTKNAATPRVVEGYNQFYIDDANLPNRQHGEQLIEHMQSAGQLKYTDSQNILTALDKVYRPDLYHLV